MCYGYSDPGYDSTRKTQCHVAMNYTVGGSLLKALEKHRVHTLPHLS